MYVKLGKNEYLTSLLKRVIDYCNHNNITIEQYFQGDWNYKQDMNNMKFCDCGCIIANNEYKCDDCKEEL